MVCAEKRQYATRGAAKASARVIKSMGSGNLRAPTHGDRLRPYLCPTCGLWHLTSKPRRGW